jgi:UDP-GlcNAc3NAcA epimerase
MKIVSVVGARPQFIKAAAVSRVLRQAAGVTEVLVHTGQHYDEDMSAIFFEELEIPEADYNLGIGSGPHGAQTGKMLEQIEQTVVREHADRVLVYGDTNSTLAGALAAAKLRIPVAHVEAGLRSFNRAMPEETNRVLTDHVSDLLFAPTEAAVANLKQEGIPAAWIHLVGDVMYDVALHYARKAEARSDVLARLSLTRGEYVLATVHRAENTDDPQRLATIFGALEELAKQTRVVIPLHPRTRQALDALGARRAPSGLRIIGPVGYLDMVALEKHARLIVTDSGGVQKEAFFHGVPCVTLRAETEWVELVAAGWNCLAPPTNSDAISGTLRKVLAAARPSLRPLLYGDGSAAQAIVKVLLASPATTVA